MSYRKGEDTYAKRRRRLPCKVIIEREKPFRSFDTDELEAECRRITNGAEFLHTMERFGDVYWHVVRFAVEHQAEAFREWLHRTRFDQRPVPQFGPTAQEQAAFEQAALVWGFRTGAIRRSLQAFRRTKGSLMQQHSAAQDVIHAYTPPQGMDIANVFLDWVNKHHWHWFHGYRTPTDSPFRPPDWYPPHDAYPHSDED